jgi:hypothetical protein
VTLTAFLALARRWGPGVVVALALFSAWVLVTQARAETAEARQELAQLREQSARTAARFHENALAADAASDARLDAALKTLKDSHDRTTTALRATLARSELRLVALDRELAGLHDAAAHAGSVPAPAPAVAPGESAGATEGPSVADLLEVVDANYQICHRNAARLGELQAWYEDLRLGKVTR